MPTIRKFGFDRSSISLLAALTYAGLAMVLFTYLVPPLLTPKMAASIPLLGSLPGDLPGYVTRFILSFLLLGVGALISARLFGWDRRDLGLVGAGGFLRSRLFLIFLAAAVIIGFLSAYSPDLFRFYPYSHTLLALSVTESGWFFLLHLCSYFIFYYIPWELFFRGFLILPFVHAFERASPAPTSRGLLMVIASFQIIPSALLHFGHPVSETASAVLFGLLAAWLVCRTRSILPGLLLHATIGLCLDTGILLRTIGVLPGLTGTM